MINVQLVVTFSVFFWLLYSVTLVPGFAQSGEQSVAAERPAKTRLNGKVEEKDKLEHLYRPANGNPLSKSVKVLSGQSYAALAPDGGKDVALDSVLRSDNFILPHQQMNLRQDLAADAGASTNPHAMRSNCPTFFAWDTAFDLRHVQASIRSTAYYMPPSVAPERGELIPGSSKNTAWDIPPVLRVVPPLHPVAPLCEEKNVLWDTWYQKVSNALYHDWLGRGEQPGEATLHITVRRSRKIEADLLHSSNSSSTFRKNLLAAVASLNGSQVLDFPSQSMKQTVSFDSVFSAGADTIAGAYSDRRGEIEQVRVRHCIRSDSHF